MRVKLIRLSVRQFVFSNRIAFRQDSLRTGFCDPWYWCRVNMRPNIRRLLSQPHTISTTHLGTAYELHCLHLLGRQLRMDLTRVGGRGDGGVDLRGWWNLPSERRLRVLGQCKAEKTKVGPRLIREMEGVARRSSWHDELALEGQPLEDDQIDNLEGRWPKPPPMITLICSSSGFSAQAMLDARSSSIPMLLLHAPFEAPMYHRASPCQRSQDWSAAEDDEDLPPPMELVENSIESSHILAGSFWNAALLGPRGVLDTSFEIRKEMLEGGQGSLTSRGMGAVEGKKRSGASRLKRPTQVLHRIGIWRDGRPIDAMD